MRGTVGKVVVGTAGSETEADIERRIEMGRLSMD